LGGETPRTATLTADARFCHVNIITIEKNAHYLFKQGLARLRDRWSRCPMNMG